MVNVIASECKKIPLNESTTKSSDYFSKILAAFDEDIVFDGNTDSFVSPTNKQFFVQLFDVDSANAIINRQPILFPTPSPGKSSCWLALINDAGDTGRMAYEAQDGTIKVLHIKDISAFNSDQTRSTVTVDKSRASEYQGEIFCIHDTAKGASLAACENFGMVTGDGRSYELILESGVKATGYTEGASVRVSGVLTPGASPLGLDGTLTVVKLRK